MMIYVIAYFVVGLLVACGIGFNPRKEFHGFFAYGDIVADNSGNHGRMDLRISNGLP